MDETNLPQADGAALSPAPLGDARASTTDSADDLTRQRGSSLPTLLWVLLGLLLVFYLVPSLVGRLAYEIEHNRQLAQWDVARRSIAEHNLSDVAHEFGAIAKVIGPSVAHIDTMKVVSNRMADEWSGLLLGPRQDYVAEGQGSGVIVDADGYLLTNWHVVENARQISVGLSDGRKLDATLVGADPLTDLAVLKVSASNLVAAEWGNSDQLDVGALVWAVGNPYGLDRSITFGIVSAKNRQFADSPRDTRAPYRDFLQSDAAVNPGNSGGPLVNVEGKVVGINTAIYGRAYQGISFSIPSNLAHEVYERIRAEGKVARGWLGASLEELTAERAREFNLPAVSGAIVLQLLPQSPARKAGLRVGDVIIEWNGSEVESLNTLIPLIGRTKIGSRVPVKVLRNGQELTLEVLVEERPNDLG